MEVQNRDEELQVLYAIAEKPSISLLQDEDGEPQEETEESQEEIEKPQRRKYFTRHMRQFPELYRSDVSIHPSYTGLRDLPYHVVCRRRVQRVRKQISKQLNREIMHFAMMQMFAIDSVRVDRVFSIGMSPETLIVPDFATEPERRRIHELLRTP